MAVDVFSETMTADFLAKLRLLGYVQLAQRLEIIAQQGIYSQQKRVVDCHVILELDVQGSWEESKEIREFLRIMDEVCWLRPEDQYSLVFPRARNPHAAWWWLNGAYNSYRAQCGLTRLEDYNPTAGFCLRMLEAVVPERILRLLED